MGALAQILKEGLREVITTAVGVEVRDRIKNWQDSAGDVSREQLLAFIDGLDKETRERIMVRYNEYDQKGKAEEFVNYLASYLASLKKDYPEEKTKELFSALAESDDFEIRMKFLKRKSATDALKEMDEKLNKILTPLVDKLKAARERRIEKRYKI